MNYYEQSSDRDPRLTISSVLLLAIFISAFAFIVAAAVWQPWNDDGGAARGVPAGPGLEEPAADPLAEGGDEIVVQPATP
jgi:hypothetical protein